MNPRRELKAAQRIAEEAARWMYTLDQADAQKLDSFSRWLLQSPLHEKAFLDVIELDETLERIKPQLVPNPPESSEYGDGGKAGFQGSLGALLAKYSHSVRKYISRREPGHHHIVEDMTQEVYLRLPRFSPGDRVKNPSAYFLQVAHNVLMDFARKQSRERGRVNFDAVQVSGYPGLAEDDWADRALDTAGQEELLRRIGKLPPIQCAALMLCRRDGLSYRETGEVLGISRHTVKKHLANALLRLRSMQQAPSLLAGNHQSPSPLPPSDANLDDN